MGLGSNKTNDHRGTGMSAFALFVYWLATIAVTLIMVYPIFKLTLVIGHKYDFGPCDQSEMQGCHRIDYNTEKEMLCCVYCGQGFLDFGVGT
jgi:hypothetical protein